MHILYIKETCSFSVKVLSVIEKLGIEVEVKDIADEKVMEELIFLGGKEQVPFLYGEDGAVNIYESDTINRYLHARFGKESV